MGICVSNFLNSLLALSYATTSFSLVVSRSSPSRYNTSGRAPKTEKKWNDSSRRRLWSRVMRRKDAGAAQGPPALLFSETTPKVQNGLRNIHLVRLKIEETIENDAAAVDSADIAKLVDSVRTNIINIGRLLDILESGGPPTATEATIINKLRNDIAKEEVFLYCIDCHILLLFCTD